jgi:hypothetical protein
MRTMANQSDALALTVKALLLMHVLVQLLKFEELTRM